MPNPQEIREAGARNSASDKKLIQQMHESSVSLGADCKMGESLILKLNLDTADVDKQIGELKEAAAILFGDSQDERRQMVARAVRLKFRDATDNYYDYAPSAYVRDMFDDVVIVSKGDDLFAVPYTIDAGDVVTLGDPTEVECAYVPVVDDETDELESLRTKPGIKVTERNIPKSARDKMDAADFAGKGKSFPIAKAGDVKAAVRSMGRAGSDNYDSATLKKNIIAIAKRKGFSAELPKEWTGGAKEGAAAAAGEGLTEFRESAVIDLAGWRPLSESGMIGAAVKTVRLIRPGWGSSGYYSKEVLKRDGPKAYPANTQMYWDHQTAAEEAARPEGSMNGLAAVTTTPAKWLDEGPAGAKFEPGDNGSGLYAESNIFSDYANRVAEKGPHTGVSIRALGKASMGEAEGRKGPIIESLVVGKSADFVTRAGAGGRVLTELAESATPAQQQQQAAESSRISQPGAVDMDEKDIQSLREAAANATAKAEKLAQDLARLQGRALVSEARGFIATKLQAVELPDVTKNLITNRESVNPPAKEDGMLDTAKFSTQIDEAVKTEAAYLAQVQGSGQVKNLGAAATAPTQIDDAKLDEQISAAFAGMGLSESAAKIAAKGRV